MTGKMFRRGKAKDRWTILIDHGYVVDPKDGKKKRKQDWIAFRGTKDAAETHMAKLVVDVDNGDYVKPTKMTVAEWLKEWLDLAVKPPAKRPKTYATYATAVSRHIVPALGHLRLKDLSPLHIERLLADRRHLKPGTRRLILAVLSSALHAAVERKLLSRVVRVPKDSRPKAERRTSDASQRCWTVDEMRAFLKAASEESPQTYTLYSLALHTGMRLSELHGLRWQDVNLDTGVVTVAHQLDSTGGVKRGADAAVVSEPIFGDPKTGHIRNINLDAETVRLLREHRRIQRELMMRNRATYRDFDLVFCREVRVPDNAAGELGWPLPTGILGQDMFQRLVKRAGVRRITFHGLRHTCATLLLGAGVPVKVVSERLGHSKITMTLDIYAHALPSMQQDAAVQLGSLMYG